VQVRVLVDAVGSRRNGRAVVAALRAQGVLAARFLPPRIPGMSSLNLRNHRKLMVVDAAVAFTGGMNIADGYAGTRGVPPIRDTAFVISGPVVHGLQETFARDWEFTTGEPLEDDPWFKPLADAGNVSARVLADGPDESFELARWVMLGAIATARRRIRIVTPYFVPDPPFIYALNVAALRGVAVEIFIPAELDHRVVKWASNALLWQVLEKGCRVWFTPPPFDHSKLCTADGVWACFGSSNWDSRSIRLNFELNLEVLDPTLTEKIDDLIEQRRAVAREVTLADMDGRTLPVRLRDGLARLMAPYL
jgi:cardiolipin synthase